MDDLIRFYTLPTVCHTHFKNSTATMNSVLHNLVCSVRTVRRVNKVSKHGEPLPMLLDWEPLPSPPLPSPPQTNKPTPPSVLHFFRVIVGVQLLQSIWIEALVHSRVNTPLLAAVSLHVPYATRATTTGSPGAVQVNPDAAVLQLHSLRASERASERMAWHGMAWHGVFFSRPARRNPS